MHVTGKLQRKVEEKLGDRIVRILYDTEKVLKLFNIPSDHMD